MTTSRKIAEQFVVGQILEQEPLLCAPPSNKRSAVENSVPFKRAKLGPGPGSPVARCDPMQNLLLDWQKYGGSLSPKVVQVILLYSKSLDSARTVEMERREFFTTRYEDISAKLRSIQETAVVTRDCDEFRDDLSLQSDTLSWDYECDCGLISCSEDDELSCDDISDVESQ